MKMDRVQFRPGLSTAEFLDRYGSDEKCEAALIESRWPSGFACPACGCGHSGSFRTEGRLYFQCTAYCDQCSVISGTIFEATKLGLSRRFMAMHLLTRSKNNVAALELIRHRGVCCQTVRLIKHKLRPSIPRSGPVSIQPSLQSALHPRSPAARRLPSNHSTRARHSWA